MSFDVVDVADQHLVGLWHQGPYERLRETFALLFPRIESLGLDQLPDSALVAVYFDDPVATGTDELRSLASVRVAKGSPTGDLQEVRLPGGTFLLAELIGSHDQIPAAWQELNEHVAGSPHRLRTAASFEVYLKNDEAAADQEITELYLPVSAT